MAEPASVVPTLPPPAVTLAMPRPRPSGIIVRGVRVLVPGVEVKTWLDGDPRVTRVTDGYPRTHGVVGIVLHTVHGRRGPLRATCGPSERAEFYARYQATTTRDVSWHFTVDTDGTVVQSADPVLWATWHAGHANDRTVGIELVQDADGVANALCGDQLGALVKLLDALAPACGVPRVTPVRGGVPFAGLFREDIWPGVYGHRNIWTIKDGHHVPVRGHGDPGDHPFVALLAAGWTGAEVPPQVLDGHDDFDATRDRIRVAQTVLGVTSDGIIGPVTRAALAAWQRAQGLPASGVLDAATWARITP